ncbi:MAG: CRISPR-associated endonuclease Cas1 [Nitrosarchaeum sp.]|nr:CRISPR-associated endonuclease Cas1 [Nitrosarchaeum sp.]
MTLRGKNNHYDIKVLSGYGCGISVSEQKLVLKDGVDVFSQKQEIEKFIPQTIPYSRIVICGKYGYLSTKAIELLAQNHINTIFLDSFGNLVATLHEVMSSFTGISRRMGQYDTFRDSSRVLKLQKDLVISKLVSQISFVTDDSSREKISQYAKKIPNCKSYKEIIGIEAKAGIVYRQYYVGLFDAKYEYHSRKNAGRRNKPRYATNVINALLNYGYSVLYSEVARQINAQGMDCFYGFYHKSHESEQALVYDLAEPYRVLVESAVLEFSNTEDRWNRISKCFRLDEKNHYQVLLDSITVKRFLETLSRKFNEKIEYVSRFGNRGKVDGTASTRMSTVMKLQIEEFAINCS